jgi:hypothetical protein
MKIPFSYSARVKLRLYWGKSATGPKIVGGNLHDIASQLPFLEPRRIFRVIGGFDGDGLTQPRHPVGYVRVCYTKRHR